MAAERALVGPGTAAVAAALLASPAHALDWSFTPTLSDSLTFTDNVELAPPGEEDWELINVISPGFNVTGDSARTTVNASYRLRALTHLRESDRDRLNHVFSGSLNSELIGENLFIDASARYSQEVLSLFGPIGLDDTSDTGNVEDVGTVSVSPYLVNRFGSFAESTLRYRHSRVYRDFSEDNYSNSASWNLDSGSRFGRLSWGLDAQAQRVTGVDRDPATFRSASASVGYELTRKLRVTASGGYEDNDYESDRADLSGEFWTVGATYAPNRRTSVSATYGERYISETKSFSITHRRRSAQLSASYSESISSSELSVFEGFEEGDGFVICLPDDPFCAPGQIIRRTIIPVFEPVNEFSYTRRGTGTLTIFGTRNTLTFNAFQVRRDFEVSEEETTQTGGSVSWTWKLGPVTSFNSTASYSRNESELSEREDDLYSFTAGFNRSIGQDINASLRYRHVRRDSNEPAGEYRENAITLTVSASF
ncbi:TIGR03016 family PEP-CTERM system-associated outer membrane protein [Sediminicurvatus halobius]|nr:TIGR03016 family PEP-CTERM system-associated outer membrane protein [Spiribacter halobius]UEX77358.1 TIGR03016 family PEP-CTERM system-associated outer membrane protein [Spiribacter halobius]